MNLLETLLSFKFKSTYSGDDEESNKSENVEETETREGDRNRSKLDNLEEIFKIKVKEHYHYCDEFYNTLSTIKKLDTDFFKSIKSIERLETYIEEMEKLMESFIEVGETYDQVFSHSPTMVEDYSAIKDFGFTIINKLKLDYERIKIGNEKVEPQKKMGTKRLPERDPEPEKRRTRRPNPKYQEEYVKRSK